MTKKATDTSIYLEEKKQQVDKELRRLLINMMPSQLSAENYDDTLKHSVLEGGKRLRPIFTIAVYELFKKSNAQIVTASCVTELIHAGSLMLDDLPCMDNAEFRRGKSSSHALYGESLTILTSAAMWVEAFNILSSLKIDKLDYLVNKTAYCMGGRGLIQGQLLDLASFNSVQTADELMECYKLKTSVMFDLAATIGAVMAGANDLELKAISSFAVNFGLAYQIRDDIIDSTQSFEETGKDTHSDEKNNKPNFVSLLGIEGAKKELAAVIDEANRSLGLIGKNDSILRSLINSLNRI